MLEKLFQSISILEENGEKNLQGKTDDEIMIMNFQYELKLFMHENILCHSQVILKCRKKIVTFLLQLNFSSFLTIKSR